MKYALTVLLLVATSCGAASRGLAQEMSWREAIEAASLPQKAEDGAQRHGYTFHLPERHRDDPKPNMTGWCRVLARGEDPLWYDKNGDGLKDADEHTPNPYLLYYELTASTGVHGPDSPPDKDGLVPEARRVFENDSWWSIQDTEWKDVAVGDRGRLAMVKRQGAVALKALRGPLSLRLSLQLFLRQRSPNGISVWSEEGSESYGSERKHHLGFDAVRREHGAAWQRIESEALELARGMLASWDAWYSKKLSDGPGPRGLFYRRQTQFLPLPGDAPPGFSLKGEFPKQPNGGSVTFVRDDERRPPAGSGQMSPPFTREQYRIDFFTFPEPGSVAYVSKPADEPIRSVQKGMQDRVADFRKAARGNAYRVSEPVPLKLAGADEAVRCLGDDLPRAGEAVATNCYQRECIFARHGNIGVSVSGERFFYYMPYPAGPSQPLPYTETLARLVLAKITGGARPVVEGGGAVRVTMTATPEALWADGKSRCTVKIDARDDAGRPAQEELTLETRGMGRLEPATVRTGADGRAEAAYVASDRPGETTVRALGKRGAGELKLVEGGLRLATEPPNAQPLADGKTPLTLVVTGVGLDGKPLAGLEVQFSEVEATVAGRVEPGKALTSADGVARFTYVAGTFDEREKRRLGDVTLAATATVGAPPAALRGELRLRSYGGETAVLRVDKAGFQAAQEFSVTLPARNAKLTGQVAGSGWQDDTFPAASARVSALGPDGRVLATAETAADGTFALEYVADPMFTQSPEGTVGPLVLKLDEDLQRRMGRAEKALVALAGRGYDLSAAAGALRSFPERLARSRSGDADPALDTAAVVEVFQRQAWLDVYVDQLDQRHAESLDWMGQSFDPVIDQFATLLDGLEEMEKAAKEKLGAAFDAGPWRKLRRTQAGRLLRTLNVWYRRNTRTLRRWSASLEGATEAAGKLGEALGMGSESEDDGEQSLPAAAQQLLKIAADPAGELGGAAAGAAGTDDLTSKLKAAVADAVKAIVRAPLASSWKERAQAALNRAGRCDLAPGALAAAAKQAEDLFTTFEQEHNQLNAAHLDRELYRLDVGLFIDTVVKGAFVYVNARGLLKGGWRALDLDGWKNVQKGVTESAEAVDTAKAWLDSAFRVYQGQFWLQDCWRASAVLDRMVKALAPPAGRPEAAP